MVGDHLRRVRGADRGHPGDVVVAMSDKCLGCEGMGRHKRWCPKVVGPAASLLGRLSMRAEDLADQIGSNNMAAANDQYRIASELRRQADLQAAAYMEKNGTHH